MLRQATDSGCVAAALSAAVKELAPTTHVLQAADAWRDDRHGAVPTTDVALADLGGEALALFNGLLASALLPLAARTFGESRRFRVHEV